jgi:hypothetical protein
MTAHDDEYFIGHLQEALACDPRTHKQDVHVSIVGSAICLSGQTTTAARRDAIAAVVAEIAPDRQVRNDITVITIAEPGAPEVVHD